MADPRLQWRRLFAPNFDEASRILGRAGHSLDKGFEAAKGVVATYEKGQKERDDNSVLNDLLKVSNEEEFNKYLSSGALANKNLSEGMKKFLYSRRRGLVDISQVKNNINATNTRLGYEGRRVDIAEADRGDRANAENRRINEYDETLRKRERSNAAAKGLYTDGANDGAGPPPASTSTERNIYTDPVAPAGGKTPGGGTGNVTRSPDSANGDTPVPVAPQERNDNVNTGGGYGAAGTPEETGATTVAENRDWSTSAPTTVKYTGNYGAASRKSSREAGRGNNYKADPAIRNIVGNAAEIVFGKGTEIIVNSGFRKTTRVQNKDGSWRTVKAARGRHPSGKAMDMWIRRPDGSTVNISDPDMYDFVMVAGAMGARGFGAGNSYMGHRTVHLDMAGTEGTSGGNYWAGYGRKFGPDFVRTHTKGYTYKGVHYGGNGGRSAPEVAPREASLPAVAPRTPPPVPVSNEGVTPETPPPVPAAAPVTPDPIEQAALRLGPQAGPVGPPPDIAPVDAPPTPVRPSGGESVTIDGKTYSPAEIDALLAPVPGTPVTTLDTATGAVTTTTAPDRTPSSLELANDALARTPAAPATATGGEGAVTSTEASESPPAETGGSATKTSAGEDKTADTPGVTFKTTKDFSGSKARAHRDAKATADALLGGRREARSAPAADRKVVKELAEGPRLPKRAENDPTIVEMTERRARTAAEMARAGAGIEEIQATLKPFDAEIERMTKKKKGELEEYNRAAGIERVQDIFNDPSISTPGQLRQRIFNGPNASYYTAEQLEMQYALALKRMSEDPGRLAPTVPDDPELKKAIALAEAAEEDAIRASTPAKAWKEVLPYQEDPSGTLIKNLGLDKERTGDGENFFTENVPGTESIDAVTDGLGIGKIFGSSNEKLDTNRVFGLINDYSNEFGVEKAVVAAAMRRVFNRDGLRNGDEDLGFNKEAVKAEIDKNFTSRGLRDVRERKLNVATIKEKMNYVSAEVNKVRAQVRKYQEAGQEIPTDLLLRMSELNKEFSNLERALPSAESGPVKDERTPVNAGNDNTYIPFR